MCRSSGEGEFWGSAEDEWLGEKFGTSVCFSFKLFFSNSLFCLHSSQKLITIQIRQWR
jgi:hypothetical protein